MTDTDPAETTHVTRLFGGPGSGKTTALLDRVEDILARDGVTVNDLLVVSYTRAAAAEVRERLAERLDINPNSLQGKVCTMHAKAYELLNLSRGDVVSEKDKQAFCDDYGLDYEDEYSGSRRRTARSTALGNKIISTSQWLQRTGRDVADWYDVPFQWNEEKVRLPPEIDDRALEGNKYTPTWPSDDDRVDVPEAIRGWRAYKGDEGLVGFADMLERVKQRSLVPHVDYLVIDEFQDITTLQYDVYQEWKPHMEEVLIAGDDDQVVYAWQGADPNLLLEEVGEDVILDTSYRLPSEILKLVQREIRHIDTRQEKNLQPRKEGGSVEMIPSPSILDLVRNVRHTVQSDDGSIMVLFRARYQLFQFIDEFIGEGIPFKVLTDQRMWTDRLNDYVTAVERISEGEPVDGLQARRLADMLMESAFGTNERDAFFDAIDERKEEAGVDDLREIEFEPDEIRSFAPFTPEPSAASEMVRKVTRYQKKSMKAYFANPAYHDVPRNRVRIGTIHSAKGREADHVFVATDLTEKVVEQMAATVEDREGAPNHYGADETGSVDLPEGEEFTAKTDPVPILTDNERRVFYVGMSRARERLVIMENLIDGAPTLPIDVILNARITGTEFDDLLSTVEEPPAAQ